MTLRIAMFQEVCIIDLMPAIHVLADILYSSELNATSIGGAHQKQGQCQDRKQKVLNHDRYSRYSTVFFARRYAPCSEESVNIPDTFRPTV